MEWVEVDSSAIARVRYEPGTRSVVVAFQSGEVYAYYPIPRSLFEEFLSSPSKGRFFEDRIKGHFIYRRADET